MPKYTFKCETCNRYDEKSLPVSEFIKNRKSGIDCGICNSKMYQSIKSASVVVEQSQDMLMMDIEEQVQQDLDNIAIGEKKTMRDLYGDDPNSL